MQIAEAPYMDEHRMGLPLPAFAGTSFAGIRHDILAGQLTCHKALPATTEAQGAHLLLD